MSITEEQLAAWEAYARPYVGPAGGWPVHHLALIAEVRLLREAATCRVCPEPATCIGAYEGDTKMEFHCSTHCGHGNEDGHCEMLI